MMRDRRWLLAALPLLLLFMPLHAQDGDSAPPASRDTAPAPTPPPPPASAPPATAPPAAEGTSTDAPDPGEERVSADNNLSFPVDI